MSKLSAKDAKEIKAKLMQEREVIVKKLNGNDLSIDDSETRRELSWCPRRTFEDGLKHTVEWYLRTASSP